MSIQFTYLDQIDSTIAFDPIMSRNWFTRANVQYALFSTDETRAFKLPGYFGQRCIIDIEMAKALSSVQQELLQQHLCLKVYDAYRPQKTVDFFTSWSKEHDTPLAKQFHYPNVPKIEFHARSYLSQTSSHTLGTAVDVTVIDNNKALTSCPDNFLGYFDPKSLDMGVGYLCFDEKSWINYSTLTSLQAKNRFLLHNLMLSHGFEPLETEFWHYYYKRERNLDTYHDFDMYDDLSL